MRSIKSIRAAALLTLTILNSACVSASNEKQSLYKHLCELYEEIDQQSIEEDLKHFEISKRVQDELSVFYEKNFVHIMVVDRNEKYRTIKTLADKATGNHWECPAIRNFYSVDPEA